LKNIPSPNEEGVTRYGDVAVTVVHGPDRLVDSTNVPPAAHVKDNEPALKEKLTLGGSDTVSVEAEVGAPEPTELVAVRR
jgi:hypothetical protein